MPSTQTPYSCNHNISAIYFMQAEQDLKAGARRLKCLLEQVQTRSRDPCISKSKSRIQKQSRSSMEQEVRTRGKLRVLQPYSWIRFFFNRLALTCYNQLCYLLNWTFANLRGKFS